VIFTFHLLIGRKLLLLGYFIAIVVTRHYIKYTFIGSRIAKTGKLFTN